jgi:hypothetical protein
MYDMPKMTSSNGTCTISFRTESEKAKAFYELIHSKSQFSGIGKNTLVVQKKDCKLLKNKNIKYEIIE